MSDARRPDLTSELRLLRSVLRQEAKRGFDNRAAIGGLGPFVQPRVADLLAQADLDLQRTLRDLDALAAEYATLSAQQRENGVLEALEALDQAQGNARPAPIPSIPAAGTTPPASPSAPVFTSPFKVGDASPGIARPAPSSSMSPASAARAEARPVPIRKATPAVPAKAPRVKSGAAAGGIQSLSDSVRLFSGVGEARAKLLAKLGIHTVRDVLRHYPRSHNDYSDIVPIAFLRYGQHATVHAVVDAIDAPPTRTGRKLINVTVRDDSGFMHLLFFNPWIERQFWVGMPLAISGRVEQQRGSIVFKSPEWEEIKADTVNTGGMIPVYPLTDGIFQKTLRSLTRTALDAAGHLIEDYLPADLLVEEGLLDLRTATEWAHYPDGDTPRERADRRDQAMRRVAFDDFLALQVGLLQRKQTWHSLPGMAIPIDRDALRRFADALPFTMTRAQLRSLKDILGDMEQPAPMTRLLQGDVGSGKTIVAATAALAAIRAGYQAALMAPTEILAEQHARGLERIFAEVPDDIRPTIALLTGSMSAGARAPVLEQLEHGGVDLIVGTHALIQEDVAYHRLGLAVIDEQHRFGVLQRTALRSKGQTVDVLIMTATPIPRTLALTLHGDLDVSTLDELPPGRQPIETTRIPGSKRDEAYAFIREEVAEGRQAFIVYPLVEESEAIEARAAVVEHERLQQEVFPNLRVGLLHGRMRGADKDAIMAQFRDRDLDILVATSVIEVGIDIPNATVMMIDGAERFGLAQLHQFRGRVGRGAARSYCILVSGDEAGETRQRLQAMVDSQDGFRLAQVDLELRGPGDFMGTRQSGLPEFTLSSFSDVRDLERARNVAERILSEDPGLNTARFALLRARVAAFWSQALLDVG